MGYENAPQTHALATHCLVCGKELCDAVSVEVGMGPVCRKRAGYQDGPEEHRAAANKQIHLVSTSKDTPERIQALQELLELGFVGVAKALLGTVATVKIAMTNDKHPHGAGRLAVQTPYNPAVVSAMRGVPGRRWDGTNKCNTFPTSSRRQLWALLKDHYEGDIGVSPAGIFEVKTAATPVGKVA